MLLLCRCCGTTGILPFLVLLVCHASTQDVGGSGRGQTDSAECSLQPDGTCNNNDNKNENKEDAAAAAAEQQQQQPIVPLECGLYMAPSTLGEDTNMGMYTGKAYGANQVINYPEIAIPLQFREWGEHRDGFSDGELWDRYIWEGSVAELDPYTDTNREDSRAVFVPGIGCTINSIMDMNNIESTSGSVFDNAGLKRTKDPGIGAFTPYHSSNTTTIVDIPPGAEIFASYGDYWIPDIEGAQITLEDNLDQAEDWLRNEYYAWIKEHDDKLNDELKQQLWQYSTTNFPLYSKLFTVLPKNVPWRDVEAALIKHKAPVFSVIKKFIRAQSVKSIEWLDKYGYCQDHIKPGRSTIEQAGRGAFASRNLPKGTVVGFSPLVHMGAHGKELYLIDYKDEVDDDDDDDVDGNNKKKKKQKKQITRKRYDLILNYSFGHQNSSILLTPYGGMVNYINHSKEKANVKLQWPSRELIAHKPDWLHKSPEELRDTVEKIGLSLEYVALRDIKEDEEVFMDYGDEWQQAWDEHVQNWQPPKDADNYVHRSEWEEDFIRTEAELKKDPYPDNLVTMCVESYTQDDEGMYWYLPALTESSHRVYCRVLRRTNRNDDDDVADDDDNDEEPLYMVEYTLPDSKNTIVVQDVDSDGIFLYDKAYSADWHLPNVFRHEIMIPDDIMPPAWLNGPGFDPLLDEAGNDDDEEDEEE